MTETQNHEGPSEVNLQYKYCKFCGQQIDKEAIICIKCGKQVEQIKAEQPNIVINNSNVNTNTNNAAFAGRMKSKWVALLLCFFLGVFGAHKFYEGKILFGILYFFTIGLLGIGVIIDFIRLLFKPDPYSV